MFRRIGFQEWAIYPRKAILDSSHPAILPLSAARDTVRYDAERDGPKPEHRFDRRMYSQFDILLRTGASLRRWTWARTRCRLDPFAEDEWA